MKEMIMWDKYDNKYREVVDVEVARGLEADLYEANNRIADLLDMLKDKDKEIEYWKEQEEGYSGLAEQLKEDFEYKERGAMMQKINHNELAKRLILRAIENYRNKFILEEDLMSGEDKRKVLEEIDKEVEEIKHKESYKKEIKRLENRIHYICGLEDCNEEFEL